MVNHLIYWCLFFFASNITLAQEAVVLIHKVSIEGQKKIELDAIKAKIGSIEGKEYSAQQVRTDVQNLFSLGFFDDIEVLKDLKNGQLDLIYRVKSKPNFSMPSIMEAGGAAPAIKPFTPLGTPTFNSSGALTNRLCTIGAAQ